MQGTRSHNMDMEQSSLLNEAIVTDATMVETYCCVYPANLMLLSSYIE